MTTGSVADDVAIAVTDAHGADATAADDFVVVYQSVHFSFLQSKRIMQYVIIIIIIIIIITIQKIQKGGR